MKGIAFASALLVTAPAYASGCDPVARGEPPFHQFCPLSAAEIAKLPTPAPLLPAQYTYIQPNMGGGYTTVTPGAQNPYTYVNPNIGGGYTAVTPGAQNPYTYLMPNNGGGYTVNTPSATTLHWIWPSR